MARRAITFPPVSKKYVGSLVPLMNKQLQYLRAMLFSGLKQKSVKSLRHLK